MEQIFFIVLVAIVGLARWLIQSAENKRNSEAQKQSSAPPDLPPGHAPTETEEERVRRFFEALGVPPTAMPPRKQPRQVTPRKPRAKPTISPIDPFPIPRSRTIPPPVAPPVETTVAEQPPPIPENPPPLSVPASTKSEIATANFEVRDPTEQWISESVDSKEISSTSAIGARLANAEGLRDAIILREIFGPPRSLQTNEHALA